MSDFVKVRAAFFCLSYYVSITTEPRFSTAIDIEKDYFLENNMIYCLRLFTALCWTKIHAYFYRCRIPAFWKKIIIFFLTKITCVFLGSEMRGLTASCTFFVIVMLPSFNTWLAQLPAVITFFVQKIDVAL